MAKYVARPKISENTIVKEINKRTGIPKDEIITVIDTMTDIIHEALDAHIVVVIKNFCSISWAHRVASVRTFWDRNTWSEKTDFVPSYDALKIKGYPRWTKKFREDSIKFWQEETNEQLAKIQEKEQLKINREGQDNADR